MAEPAKGEAMAVEEPAKKAAAEATGAAEAGNAAAAAEAAPAPAEAAAAPASAEAPMAVDTPAASGTEAMAVDAEATPAAAKAEAAEGAEPKAMECTAGAEGTEAAPAEAEAAAAPATKAAEGAAAEEPESAKAEGDAATAAEAAEATSAEAAAATGDEDKTAAAGAEEEWVEEPGPVLLEIEVAEDGTLTTNVSVEDAAWLEEDGGKRRRRLERLIGATAEVESGESCGKLQVKARTPDASGAEGAAEAPSAEWVGLCVSAMCALRAGTDTSKVSATMKPQHPFLRVVDVPTEDVKGYIKGKEGKRLADFCEELDVVCAFAPPLEEPAPEVEPPPKDDLPEVGEEVEAKYGAEWHTATVLEAEGSIVKVKWGFDDSEEQLVKTNVKKKEIPPVPPPERLLLFATDARARLQAECRALKLVDFKSPGYVTAEKKPPGGDDEAAPGCSVLTLKEDQMGKLIGKGGVMRQKISKACKSIVQYIGHHAWIVGNAEERARTVALLELMQSAEKSKVEGVPDVLEALCTRLVVPEGGEKALFGEKRATMNGIEEETGTVVLSLQASDASETAKGEEEPAPELVEGTEVECRQRGRQWFKGTILEVSDWGCDSDEEEGADPKKAEKRVKLKWADGGAEAVVTSSALRRLVEGPALEARKKKEIFGDYPLTVVLFGPERPRKTAELKMISVIEAACPGSYAASAAPGKEDGDFGTQAMPLGERPVERCGSADGAACVRRAAAAAGCLAELVGAGLHIAGTGPLRRLAVQYLRSAVEDTPSGKEVDDMEAGIFDSLSVPTEKCPNLTNTVLTTLEKETETFLFFDESKALAGIEDSKRLVVCGHDGAKRATALARLGELQDQAPPEEWDSSNKTWDDGGGDKWGKSNNDWAEDKKSSGWKDKGGDDWGGDKSGSSWKDKGGDDKSWGGDKSGSSWNDKGGDDKSWAAKSKDSGNSWDKKNESKSEWGEQNSWDKKEDKKESWGGKNDWKEESWKKEDKWDNKQKDDKKEWGGKNDWKEESWKKEDNKWDNKQEDKKDWGGKKEESWKKDDNKWDNKQEDKKDWGGKNEESWKKDDNKWDNKQEDKKDWGGKNESWKKEDKWDNKQEARGKSSWEDDKQDKRGKNSWGDDKQAAGGNSSWEDKNSWEDKKQSWDAKPKKDEWQGASSDYGAKKGWEQQKDAGSEKRSWGDSGVWSSEAEREPKRQRGDSDWGRQGGRDNQEPTSPPRGGAYIKGGREARYDSRDEEEDSYGKRRRVDAPPARGTIGHPGDRLSHRGAAPRFQPASSAPTSRPAARTMPRTNPRQVLDRIGFPETAGEWCDVQEVVFKGFPRLPEGWIRVWSRSSDSEYYMRLVDQFTTFDIEDCR